MVVLFACFGLAVPNCFSTIGEKNIFHLISFHFQRSQLSYFFMGSVLEFFISIDENEYLFASTGFPDRYIHKVSWMLERMIFPILWFCQDCFSCSRMSILQSNFMVNSGYLQKQSCCFDSNCIKPINYFKEYLIESMNMVSPLVFWTTFISINLFFTCCLLICDHFFILEKL